MNKRGTSRPQRHTLCRQHQDRRPPARARPGGVLLLRRSRSLAAGHGRHRDRPRPLARRDGGEARSAGLPGELRQKSVVFALNDLSQVKPPAAALAPGDQFIGPVFDESAIRFFLVFNAKLKSFHYILDETVKTADGARIAVTPYMEYRSPKDLAIFDRCATSRRIAAERDAACFALALEGDHGANARPLAMQRHAR